MPTAGELPKVVIQIKKIKKFYSHSSVFVQNHLIRTVRLKTIIYIGRIKNEQALGCS